MLPTPSMPNKSKSPLQRFFLRAYALLRSSRGRDVLIFCAFVLVSYGFWVILSLNDDVQRELHVKLEIANVPEDVTFITEPPHSIQVNVRDKGSVLASYVWNGAPSLKIDYDEMEQDALKDRVVLGEQQMQTRIHSLFPATAQVVSLRPDSLSLVVTDRPGHVARVIPDVKAVADPQCVISGAITVSPDTVTVYSARHLAATPRTVKTMTVNRTDLKDTLVVEVRLHPESGVRMVPDRVKVTIPVEPLIAKKRTVPVTLLHGQHGQQGVVMFPSAVTVSYLVPMSMYGSESGVVTVNADFHERTGAKIPLSLGAVPDYYQGVSLSADSVEYLIEQKAALPPK